MIDLHTHTTFSDGQDSVIDSLKKAQSLGLNAYSITDHNTVKAYDYLKTINYKDYFKGKILKGVEIHCGYKGFVVELLGYGINTEIIKPFLEKHFAEDIVKTNFAERLQHLEKVCEERGIRYKKCTLSNLIEKGISAGFYLESVRIFPENEKFFTKEVWDNYTRFTRTCFFNPDHYFYYNVLKEYPKVEEVASEIHKAGGKAVFAHAFIYNIQKNANSEEEEIEDVLKFAKQLVNDAKLDGIEAFYTKFTKNQSNAIISFAKENKLIITGGSDYHGEIRGWEMGTGVDNNLNISDEILLQFTEKDFI